MRLLLRRLVAYGLDVFLLFVVLAPAGFFAQRAAGYVPQTGPEVWLTLLLTFSLPTWLYFIYCDRSERGASVGKRAFGLRVSATVGARLSIPQATSRTALKLLPWELAHASAFALSIDTAALMTVQVAGLAVANALALAYFGVAVATGGRWSVHDLASATEVRSVR